MMMKKRCSNQPRRPRCPNRRFFFNAVLLSIAVSGKVSDYSSLKSLRLRGSFYCLAGFPFSLLNSGHDCMAWSSTGICYMSRIV